MIKVWHNIQILIIAYIKERISFLNMMNKKTLHKLNNFSNYLKMYLMKNQNNSLIMIKNKIKIK